MPNIDKKQAVVDEIKAKLEKATSIVLVESRGLTVEQDTGLRKKLREAEVDYKVYKNTLLNIAIKGTKFEGLKDHLSGPSAVAICYQDPTIAARTINKELKVLPKLKFKASFIENVVYDADGTKAVANIPSKEELISKLLGSFKSPVASFARVVQAIADKQNGNQDVV